MADIVITAANVLRVSGDFEVVTAGVTVTAGQVVYRDTSDGQYNLTGNSSLATSLAAGISLNGASVGQPLVVQTSGDITIGGTVAVGEVYLVSATGGLLAPEADVLTADYVTLLGVGISATVIRLNIRPYEVAIPS